MADRPPLVGGHADRSQPLPIRGAHEADTVRAERRQHAGYPLALHARLAIQVGPRPRSTPQTGAVAVRDVVAIGRLGTAAQGASGECLTTQVPYSRAPSRCHRQPQDRKSYPASIGGVAKGAFEILAGVEQHLNSRDAAWPRATRQLARLVRCTSQRAVDSPARRRIVFVVWAWVASAG